MVTIDTIPSADSRQLFPLAIQKGASSPLSSLARMLKLWWRARKTRVQLSQLTEEQLRDVGLSSEMAAREIRKSRLLLLDRPVQPPM
jgi:uncharacterized protein YjiS (DUF1127 family)